MCNLAWMMLLLFVWIRSSSSSSSSGGAGVAPQTCGTDNRNFYCRYDPNERCKPRYQRCTGSNICNNPATMMEDGCLETTNPGEYNVQKGHTKLGSSFSSRKRFEIHLKYEHQFITFRGFTYEFGKSYAAQILDITDPKYKYRNGLNGLKRIETLGPSYCSWEDANMFVDKWNKKYRVFTHNCQHFAAAMSKTLLKGPCNRFGNAALRSKRQDSNDELAQYIDMQLRNCSLVCCYDNSSATFKKTSGAWVIFTFATIISFVF